MDNDWTRYSCQMKLPDFGSDGQQRLHNAKVLIVGAGGLGCPAAQYLTACGIGTIAIADNDIISAENLHRQILYGQNDIGQLKVLVACGKLKQQNPQIEIVPIVEKITSENVMGIMQDYEIVVDCTDNFETKYLLNDACVLLKIPLVFGAIYQYEGQVSVFNVQNKDGSFSPNYRDLFPDINATQIPDCTDGGVLPTVAGIVGCMQANEVVKYFTGTSSLLSGKMLLIDSATLQTQVINTGANTKTRISHLQKLKSAQFITAEEMKNNLDKNIYELIDVRTEHERNAYHIGGRHIPLHDIAKMISLIDFTKPVVLYCQSGRRSAEAAIVLSDQFPGKPIFSLEGGIKKWKMYDTEINEIT